GRVLARVRAVDVPVAADGGEPRAVVARDQREARDRALAQLVVAVEHVDHEPLARLDRTARICEALLRRVAERALPEADLAGRDVQVAGQPPERLDRRMFGVAEGGAGEERP